MRKKNFNTTLMAVLRTAGILLSGAVATFGQQQVNLTAGPATATLPDGTAVPMWGYSCGTAATGSTATCAALSKAATTPAVWSPVVITVPAGQSLRINLTNNLVFGANRIPTSLVIVGQLGGGLGVVAQRTTVDSPNHSGAQANATWPIVGGPSGVLPPSQGARVQSFSTEVLPGAAVPLTWTNPRPGTYLLESGTHPSIQGPMGLYGIVVVTTAPAGATAGTAYPAAGTTPAVTYNADVPLVFSEIDPVQNNSVNTAVNTTGFSETAVWSGQPGGCGVATVHTCYPPAVNYTPLYYLINGTAFNKTNATGSLFAASPATGVAGQVLLRLVNAGLRMHVPSVVGSQTGTAVAPAVPPSGFSLIAEDGNQLPGVPRVQSEVFMAAGKTYDVMINIPAAGPALPVFDRQGSLSGNATGRDTGMLAYVSINGAGLPASPSIAAAQANPDTYTSVISCTVAPCKVLTVSDPNRGVVANDVNVYGVTVFTQPSKGTLVLNADGTFTYTPNVGWSGSDTFVYNANGTVGLNATVTLAAATIEAGTGITVGNLTYTATTSTKLTVGTPGILSVDNDGAGYPLNVALATVAPAAGLTLNVSPTGGFTASVGGPGTYTFTYKAQNSQGTLSAATATVTLVFPRPTGLAVSVVDSQTKAAVTDYRWIIEEDRTFYIDPKNITNTTTNLVPVFGVNFHTSYMPVVAQGCTGPLSCESGQTVFNPATNTHVAAVCDVGNGACRPGTQQTITLPSQVVLNPAKRYYISILPGDSANPFIGAGNGHTMGGAQIAAAQTAVTVLVSSTPLQPAKVSVFVFQDDQPLNGEHDAGGGIDVLAPNEPGLGGFEITLFDDAGGTGDPTGQMTYDMFNMPLSNSLAGTFDPATGLDACPISSQASTNPAQKGITGMIVTCPLYESDGASLSPLAGQAVIANLMPGRYGIVATPAADRIARGEEWLQTNTLDGQKAHDSFLRVGEPAYFQEFGPAAYHVAIGFANPKIINGRKPEVCAGITCTASITGKVTTERLSRTPDERLYSSGSRDSFAFTQCYVSLGDTDGADFEFVKCDSDGNFTFTGVPAGNWRITLFDQWNDQIVDGLSVPVAVTDGQALNMGDVPVMQWHANLYTRTFFDQNGDGVSQDGEPGLSLVPTNIRFRDGSFSNFNSTDLNGNAGFNEVFPLFNWYVVEADSTRYKNTGIHVVYDAGGPADGSPSCGQTGYPPCGTGTIGQFLANTAEQISLPTNLRVPGAVYCNNSDCPGKSIANGPGTSDPPTTGTNYLSTGRIDPPWVTTYGWQGFIGQNSFLEFGKAPYVAGENGGIRGHVVYASTRPFDDPQLLLQTSWEPLVPNVTINLYQEGTAPDGSQSLKLVDATKTSSWDDWAQGFRTDNPAIPNMNCPGQTTADLFYFTLLNQPNYLNQGTPLPNGSQFKCYDGMHNFNQLQPAPYDGMYQFPSVTGTTRAANGKPLGTNCHISTTAEPWGCIPNPLDATSPMLAPGKYVVEVVVPPGYELVKEEDKNILIGDNFIAPAVQQFGPLASIFILPDQAAVAGTYNANNPQNPTQNLGRIPSLASHEGDTGTVETYWPCVGQMRVVPDFISLYPGSAEVAPFAGATRPLCDRKEVTLEDQSSALAKFYIFTSTHAAAHFTGQITDDFTSEFDPFAPSFGEKFAPPNVPISIKDFNNNEISRVYSDHWGVYNGLNYSTWEVNPPNPTGYAPTMMVVCMNDAGPIPDPAHPGQFITDPLYDPAYSQFCYELPFMPGQTQYMDTPVVPTSAFAAGYNHPDCNYPDATPAIKEVDGDGIGPWVSAAGHTITITALGDQTVTNYGYSGPSAKTSPFNQKLITRHYGFGGTAGTVTIGGVAATVGSWGDLSITATVPGTVPLCGLQQMATYGGSTARCGQLVVTAANGKQSVDTVTVTVGGKTPSRVAPPATIQGAIDAAAPGDLIIVQPGTYNEMLLMWKPVRLQGVGSASSIVNANPHPAGKLDPWRRQVVCLFGLALNGVPYTAGTGTNPYDPNPNVAARFSCPASGWNYFNGGPNNPQVDRIPLEGVVGWDASLNGNLADMLQEPTLMGAYEGAGITVLAKGVRYPAGAPFLFGNADPSNPLAHEGQMPLGTVQLQNIAADCNDYTSNFWCNPSRIDGLTIENSSQGGGGIFMHGWSQNLEIANNRITNNTGTLGGGINVGQGEAPDAWLIGNDGNPLGFDQMPWTCLSQAQQNALPTNAQVPFCFNTNANIHNNAVVLNSSLGDELFSATPAGAGGVVFCTGADYYKFNYNWVCGNLSTGDGGGIAHAGFAWNGDIEHNTILFNQSTNPTVPANGGGIAIMTSAPDGSSPTQPECGSVTDVDCAPGLGDGIGPGLIVNANLILGNAAESGSGGGIRFQGVNGTEVGFFPNNPERWYSPTVTNNIIANNVAGWQGGGVSLVDSLAVNFVNNTVIANDSTASSGVLFNTLGAPEASVPPPTGGTTTSPTASAPQPAGLATQQNTVNLTASLPASITCPSGHPNCRAISNPLLYNNVFWQNRTFYVAVGALSPQYQQNLVGLYDSFTVNLAASQPATPATTPNGGGLIVTGGTGACVPGVSYWDLGVRGDTGPTNHSSGFTMAPTYSVLSNITGYNGASLHNSASNPTVLSQYCNGSRVPPENGGLGFQVPPGISDATVPNPIFNLMPSATVDEGNNWINITWGPLALNSPMVPAGNPLGNYSLAAGSPAINYIPPAATTYALAPATDFFGNPRKTAADPVVDVGAVEATGIAVTPTATVTGGPLAFGNVAAGTTSAAQTLTLTNGATGLTTIGLVFTSPYSRPAGGAGGTCGTTLAAGANCTISVVFSPTAVGAANGTLTISAAAGAVNAIVTGSPVTLTGTGVIGGTVTGGPLTFSTSVLNVATAAQTVTVTNTSPSALAGLAFTIAPPFSRSTTAAGNCGTTLAAGANCTYNVVFTATTFGSATGTLTVAATGATFTGSPVSLTGTALPTLATLDDFNRATVGNLNNGTNWRQLVIGGTAAVQVLDLNAGNTTTGAAYCNNTGTIPRCLTGGQAYWNNPTAGFGSRQAASFVFRNIVNTGNALIPGYSLILKATGINLLTQIAGSNIRVAYNPGTSTVTVAFTTNSGVSYTTAGTITGATFAAGNTMGAMVTQTGLVSVWKTAGATTTLLGSAQLPNVAAWTTGGGAVGIQLTPGAEVDNLAGGLVP